MITTTTLTSALNSVVAAVQRLALGGAARRRPRLLTFAPELKGAHSDWRRGGRMEPRGRSAPASSVRGRP